MSEYETGNGLTPEVAATGHLLLSRRLVIRLGWMAAGAVFLGGQLWLFLKLFLSPAPSRKLGEPVVVGPAEGFAIGSTRHFWKQRFILVRHATGFLALSHQCTHQKCTVDLLPDGQEIFCPCHGSRFSLTGAVITGPAQRPLDRYKISIRDGQVVVDTSRQLQAKTL